MGLPRNADSQGTEEADPHFHLGRRQGFAQPQRDARRDARLGGSQSPDGQGTQGEGLRISVPLLPRCRPQCWQRSGAAPPARYGMGVERLLAEGREVAFISVLLSLAIGGKTRRWRLPVCFCPCAKGS